MGGEAITRPVLVAESTIFEVTGALKQVDDPSRVGRARQLYAAIWEQLDQARAAAASAGYSVDGFDAVRATRPDDLFATEQTPMQVKDGVDFVAQVVVGVPGRPSVTQLDLRGLVVAKQCVDLLRQAAPELPWQEEQQQLAMLGDTNVRSGRGIAVGILVLLVAAVIGIVAYVARQF